jgi:hypothetical protein
MRKLKYIKLFENYSLKEQFLELLKEKNIDIEEILYQSSEIYSSDFGFSFDFSIDTMSLNVYHSYIYPSGNREAGLSQLNYALDRTLAVATEKMENELQKLGMNNILGEGDDTSHGRNCFKNIRFPELKQSGLDRWTFKLILND